MTRNRPLSPHATNLLVALAIRPSDWCYGYELMQKTDIKSGTLYPILMRLADKGLLESKWMPPEQEGRPARHAYRLTDAGLLAARQADAQRPVFAPSKEQLA
jgi:PadR family transcriptional regulator, regulatory protein PadR